MASRVGGDRRRSPAENALAAAAAVLLLLLLTLLGPGGAHAAIGDSGPTRGVRMCMPKVNCTGVVCPKVDPASCASGRTVRCNCCDCCVIYLKPGELCGWVAETNARCGPGYACSPHFSCVPYSAL